MASWTPRCLCERTSWLEGKASRKTPSIRNRKSVKLICSIILVSWLHKTFFDDYVYQVIRFRRIFENQFSVSSETRLHLRKNSQPAPISTDPACVSEAIVGVSKGTGCVSEVSSCASEKGICFSHGSGGIGNIGWPQGDYTQKGTHPFKKVTIFKRYQYLNLFFPNSLFVRFNLFLF